MRWKFTVIIFFVAVAIAVGVWYSEQNKPVEVKQLPAKAGIINQISKNDAFNLLKRAHPQNNKECDYYDNCFDKIISEREKNEIALAYGVINVGIDYPGVNIGLLKGSSVDITGIGTGYLQNKEKLNLMDTNWYWEIGSCATNKRVYVDAISGTAGLLHSYVYCGGMP